ncbi:MAG: hypothetical protein ACRCUT_11255, partial [Spirochaetota bacterium]
MAQSGSGAKKILIYFTITQSLIILLLTGVFSLITSKNASFIRSIISEYSTTVAVDTSRAAASAAWTSKEIPSKDFMARLFSYCRGDAKILSAILFSKTADENFFKVAARIDLGAKITLPVEIGQRVRESTEENWLKKGIYGISVDPALYSNKEKTLYWHNAYIPVQCKDGRFVARFMISASDAVFAMDDYFGKVNRMRMILIIITAVLLASSVAASAIFLHNFSLFITGLTGYVRKAAEGDTTLSLTGGVDEDLSELALSFNTLVGELKEKSRVIAELSDREKDVQSQQSAGSAAAEKTAMISDLQQKLFQAQADKERMLAEQNRQDELSEIFRKGVEILKKERYDDAVSIFTALTVLKPDGFGGYFNLGVAYAKLCKFDRSL